MDETNKIPDGSFLRKEQVIHYFTNWNAEELKKEFKRVTIVYTLRVRYGDEEVWTDAVFKQEGELKKFLEKKGFMPCKGNWAINNEEYKKGNYVTIERRIVWKKRKHKRPNSFK